MSTPEPFRCFLFILGAFIVGGCAQTVWFRSAVSRRLLQPLDGGITWRGKRLFGDNKTLRGFMVIVPVTAMAFVLLDLLPGWPGPWQLAPVEYAAVGAWAAFGFMAGELPNSFMKRRLGVGAGQAAQGGRKYLFAVVDRIDSILGMLLALAVVVPVPWQTWLLFLVLGPGIHGAFSLLMFRVGAKARVA